ncbi:NAD-dependent epimerase/dehydratase family protein [Polymorphum gilvum]|uniref:Putative sugar nucleotide oxidoreductaseepimerase protein n=1 Tax=Polymorphum gilvum (strain LMG 25793 / CGMCC 1.9160 / SL003B-26A1) TaxID=991905 RepID=F2IVH7_POLGS|nr:SDR family oxidoreductase [Polymorphum gilvum]ADZ72695.1 Putative sugar nucleotide oxidoreductaseepimerase protein [Polymorphum gilvum SL003B-26A1]
MAASPFTVFGAAGFVGARLVAHLGALGHEVRAVGRDSWPKPGEALGHVLFTVGMTAQFRGRPFETVETQTLRAYEALRSYRFESFLYLSSTRLYQGAGATAEETPILARPATADAIYNLTKATAECLCLSLDDPAVRVVRLSNVFGPENDSELFVSDVMREAAATGRLVFRSAPASAKDYVHVADVAELLPRIALSGRERLYNLAFGRNVSNRAIGDALAACGIDIAYQDGAPEISFPQIDIARLMREFPRPTRGLLAAVPELLEAAQKRVQT